MELEELFLNHKSVTTSGFCKGAFNPGLDTSERFDSILGYPSRGFRSIHVAGTNGKGSVSSMLAASLAARGLRTGLYTSPHLVDFRERMKIVSGTSFEMIPEEDVRYFLDAYDRYARGMSFFEVTTGMAFWWFAKRKVDIAVIEVGLGGRLDCTNIITPELSIITSIGLDHCEILGDTRARIAWEKAGIFKQGVPALVWGHDAETDKVFEDRAAELGCPLHFADSRPFESNGVIDSLDLQSPCQKENLRTVFCALDILGVQPELEAISHAASITGLHGRWEKVPGTTPEGRKIDFIFDIGHNPAALRSNLSGEPAGSVIVYGVMADKDYRTNIAILPKDSHIVVCAPDTPRALPVEALEAAFGEVAPELKVTTSLSVADAVDKALALSDAIKADRILVIGSTFVVSDAVKYLKLYD